MNEFFKKLKETFEKIPTKTRFLKDLGLTNSYVGFRYFMHGRKDEPSQKFMELICDKINYDYVLIPVKRDEDHQELKGILENAFIEDLENYLKIYENDKGRTYTKNFGQESATAKALEAFEKEVSDPKSVLDVSELF